MADYDDPRSNRPPSDRRGAADADSNAPAGSDPLEELARIVSGSPDDSLPPRRSFTESGGGRHASDLARDLEAELLENLQASFDALRAPLDSGADDEAAADSQPEPEAAELEPGPAWDAPAQDAGYDEAQPDDLAGAPAYAAEPVEEDPFNPTEPQPAYEPYTAEYAAEAEAGDDAWQETPATGGWPAGAYQGDYAETDEPADAVPTEADPYLEDAAPESEDRPDRSFEDEDDPFLVASGAAPPLLGRWATETEAADADADGYGDEAFGDDPFAASETDDRVDPYLRPIDADWDDAQIESAFRFGHRPGAGEPYLEPDPDQLPEDREPEFEFAAAEESYLADDEIGAADPDDRFDEDQDYQAPVVAPASFGEGDRRGQAAGRGSSGQPRRGMMIAGAVLAIVLVGAVTAVAFFRNTDVADTLPPVIAASNDPFKIEPPDTAESGDDPQSGKLSYDRIIADDQANAPQLSASSDEPVLDVPAPPEPDAASQQISRIILPDPTGGNDPAPPDGESMEVEPPAAAGNGDELAIQPKRVRTVVVKPDGTILSNESDPVDEAPAMTPPEPPRLPDASADAGSGPTPAPIETPRIVETPPIEVPEPATAAAEVPEPEPAVQTAPKPTVVPPVPTARPNPPVGNTTVAVRQPDPGQPISLGPNVNNPPPAQVQSAPAPAPTQIASAPPPSASGPTPGGDFVVQVSSQRSQEAALSTYGSLQSRFPSFLGNFQPNIQRADLGERGVYYRVRVGPMASREAAISFCEQFKAAGGDCIVAQN